MLPRWVDNVEREALVAGESLPYMANPDRVLGDPLSETELRRAWAEVNDKLTSAFEGFTWEDWLQSTQQFPLRISSRILCATGLPS